MTRTSETGICSTKAGSRTRRGRKAARKRRVMKKPYQSAPRPEKRRVRVNRKAERFDVDEGRGWIVVRAEAGRYAECAAILRSADCPVFEARQEVRSYVDGQSRITHPPMMRRLLFVGVDAPEQACLLASLGYVESVFCRGDGVWLWADPIAIHGARPALIPPVMMAKFADHITGHLKDGHAVGEFVRTLFGVGDNVRVTDGPFASFDAIVMEVEQDRYKVAVQIFGRATSVALEEKQLEAA